MIHWAGLEGRQTAMVSRLFTSYFRDGQDIGDPDVLLTIAEAIGMDRAMTERLLTSDADAEDIRTRDAHARERGVTGVPTFVLANQHVLVGAQPTDLWEKVIGDIAQQFAENASD
jgi:predicted DsbA family dithiol-disulfide isomerase